MSTARSPIPLYVQVADAIRQRIQKGVWQPGEMVPTLEALAADFSVARVTARQAVQLLTEQGLLAPRRGKGTFVTETPVVDRTVNMRTSLEDLGRMYESTTPQILNMEEGSRLPPMHQASTLLDERYVFMRRVHFIEGAPYSVISLYLRQAIFDMAPDEFRSKAVIPILLRLPGIDLDSAHQTMTIASADSETAQLLHVSQGSPIAHVNRVFRHSNGMVLYYADVAYRGDWVRWEVDLKR